MTFIKAWKFYKEMFEGRQGEGLKVLDALKRSVIMRV